MKSLAAFLAALVCCSASAAVSDILFPTGGGNFFAGTPGNLIFDGQQFVTVGADSGNVMILIRFDTNGVVTARTVLVPRGGSPRIAQVGTNFIFAWIEATADSAILKCGLLSDAAVIGKVAVATNVASETVSISRAGSEYLLVWQTAGTNSAVFAQMLGSTAQPVGAAFVVSAATTPQLFPSAANDGTNHLVCWMEQNETNTEWRVVARIISQGTASGSALTISESNSVLPHATACAFGTNYLVTWSSDIRWDIHWWDPAAITNHLVPLVVGRSVSASGTPINTTIDIGRYQFTNINPALVFDGTQFLVTWANDFEQRVEVIGANGIRRHWPIRLEQRCGGSKSPRIATGAGRVLAIYPQDSLVAKSLVLAPAFLPDMRLVNVRYSNGALSMVSSTGWREIEISTDFLTWTGRILSDLPSFTNYPRLFVRQINAQWRCIEQLRQIEWAKQKWALDQFRSESDTPLDTDLFSGAAYIHGKPSCPEGGAYILNTVNAPAACSVTGHTL